MYLCTTAVFSDPYLLNPDQAKKNQSRKPLSPDSDPSCFVTLPGPAASDYVSKKSYYTSFSVVKSIFGAVGYRNLLPHLLGGHFGLQQEELPEGVDQWHRMPRTWPPWRDLQKFRVNLRGPYRL